MIINEFFNYFFNSIKTLQATFSADWASASLLAYSFCLLKKFPVVSIAIGLTLILVMKASHQIFPSLFEKIYIFKFFFWFSTNVSFVRRFTRFLNDLLYLS